MTNPRYLLVTGIFLFKVFALMTQSTHLTEIFELINQQTIDFVFHFF